MQRPYLCKSITWWDHVVSVWRTVTDREHINWQKERETVTWMGEGVGEDGGTDGHLRTPNVSFSPTPHLPPPPASPVSNNGLIISKMLRAETGKVPSALSRDISNSRLPAAGKEKVKNGSYRSIEWYLCPYKTYTSVHRSFLVHPGSLNVTRV